MFASFLACLGHYRGERSRIRDHTSGLVHSFGARRSHVNSWQPSKMNKFEVVVGGLPKTLALGGSGTCVLPSMVGTSGLACHSALSRALSVCSSERCSERFSSALREHFRAPSGRYFERCAIFSSAVSSESSLVTLLPCPSKLCTWLRLYGVPFCFIDTG